jgi:hypothetical protein
MEPQLPALLTLDLRRKFYGKTKTNDLICKLLIAQNVAPQNIADASNLTHLQFDSKAAMHKFLLKQLFLLDEHSFLSKNQKLAPKW